MPVPLLKKIGLKFSLNDPRWGRGSDNNEPPQNQDNKRPMTVRLTSTSSGVTSISASIGCSASAAAAAEAGMVSAPTCAAPA